MDKTYFPKAGEIVHEWWLVDANGQNLGRLASQIANILLGKHKATFTPGVDTGDYVVVVNCEHIKVTGTKLDDKYYYRHSMYPGGLKSISLRNQLARYPERVIRSAVWGMLPKNKYGRRVIKKLKIYDGPDHPHAAQQPQTLDLGKE